MADRLTWNDGRVDGTGRVGYFDWPEPLPGLAAKLARLGAEDLGPGDKTTMEFDGTFNGATFALYDYKGDTTLHIGGHDGSPDDGFGSGPALDVAGFTAHLRELLATVA